MITLISTLPEVEADSAVLARIKCTFCAYGKYPDIALFWQQTNDSGKIISLLCSFDNNMTVWSKSADAELKNFISAIRATTVFAEADVAASLGVRGDSLYAVMTLSGATDTKNIVNTDALYEIFKGEFNIVRAEFIADVSHRLRHGSGKCVIKENSAAFMQLSETCGYITGIVVAEKDRFKGQGSALLGELLELNKQMKVYACCSEKVLPFYIKNNFSKISPCVIGSI